MIPSSYGETFNVFQYEIGQKYDCHYDAFNPNEYGPQKSQHFGGAFWLVPTGRRDESISNQSEALQNIPQPTFNFSQLNSSFSSKGLDSKDLVILSGGHTVGIGNCQFFKERLYNFSGNGNNNDTDPSNL